MWEAIGAFFVNLVSPLNPIWLYYPLCAVAAVVYKATKFDRPRDIARASVHFFFTVTLGMLALALAFYLMATVF